MCLYELNKDIRNIPHSFTFTCSLCISVHLCRRMTEYRIENLIKLLCDADDAINQIKDVSDKRRVKCIMQEARILAKLLQKEYTQEKIENEVNRITRCDNPNHVDAYWEQMKCDGDYMG